MPPKSKSVICSILFLFLLTSASFSQAPTTADIMRDRISEAKSQLVVKNYSAAIYELESIRRETNDRTIHRVLNVLLMHAYLEQGDYERTQEFLTELYKSKRPTAALDYLAVAGQVVSGSKTQLKRYQVLGLKVSDEKLPAYAVEDLDQMRKTLELIIEQSKTLGGDEKISANIFALLEETSSARGSLGRDEYDVKRWENEIIYARQQIASSGTRVIDIANDPPINAPDPEIVSASLRRDGEPGSVKTVLTEPSNTAPRRTPVKTVDPELNAEKNPPLTTKIESESSVKNADASETPTEKQAGITGKTSKQKTGKDETQQLPVSENLRPTDRRIRVIGSAERNPDREVIDNRSDSDRKSAKTENERKSGAEKSAAKEPNQSEPATENDTPLPIGSLIAYATKKVNPIYPRQAKSMRMTGIVKIELVIDEDGSVSKIENAEGPSLLQRAALDVITKWHFRPFERDGQPVKATGYVSFNFNL